MIIESFSLFLSILFGFLLGMGVVFLIVFVSHRKYTKNKSIRIKRKIKNEKQKSADMRKKSIYKGKKEQDNGNELLQNKLKKPDLSYVEFNCAADGVDESDYIRKRQAHEDQAYNILRNKTKK